MFTIFMAGEGNLEQLTRVISIGSDGFCLFGNQLKLTSKTVTIVMVKMHQVTPPLSFS